MNYRSKSALFFVLAVIFFASGSSIVTNVTGILICAPGVLVSGLLGLWFYFRPFTGKWTCGDATLQIKFLGKWTWSNGLRGHWEPDGRNKIKLFTKEKEVPELICCSPEKDVLKGPLPKYFWKRVGT